MQCRTHGVAAFVLALTLFAATESAAVVLPQRTFVASSGNDANPCSLTLPCRAFAAAIAQTVDGGEVIVLDSAGYGPVTITQSVSIIAPAGVYAGVSVSTGTGVTVNAAASATVVLRGLTINGVGGANGVAVNSGASVDIGRVEVSGFTGDGILFNGGNELIVRDSIVRRNGGNGLTAVAANATLTVKDSTFDNNLIGVIIDGSLAASIANSTATGNPNDAFVAQGGGRMQVSDCRANGTGAGVNGAVRSDGAGTTVQVNRCEVSNYGRAYVAINGGSMQAFDSVATGLGTEGTGFLSGSGATMDVERSTATNFVLGVWASGGTVRVSNSTIIGNGTDFESVGTFFSRTNNTATSTSGAITPLPPL